MKEATLSTGTVPRERLAIRIEPVMLTLATALIFGFLLYTLLRIPTDYNEHSKFARQLGEGVELPHAHILFQLATLGVHRLALGQISYKAASSLAALLCYIGTALILYQMFLSALPGRRWLVAGLALTTLLVSHIFLVLPEKPYMGYISPNTYHNPTAVIARPFALLMLLASVPLLQHHKVPVRQVILLAGATLLALLAKPNYVLCLMPALGVVALWRRLRHRPVALMWLIVGGVIPAAIMLALQFSLTYQAQTDSGLALAPLEFAYRHDSAVLHVLIKFLASVAFPATVYLLCFQQARRDLLLNVAWLAFIFGCAQYYLLIETGERAAHGNWMWGAQIGLFVLFALSLPFLVRNHGHLNVAQRWIAWGVLGLHLISGVAFYGLYLGLPATGPIW